jgi:hypothetical protein
MVIMNQIKRIFYLYYLKYRIIYFWIFWYCRNAKKIKIICVIFDNWNSKIPYFSHKYPSLNRKAFIKNYKYWIHWVKKMDYREKVVFNYLNPYLLINKTEWVYLDLSKREVPVVSYYYYFVDSQWIPIEIFKSLEHLQVYLCDAGSTSDTLIKYIDNKIHSEILLVAERKINLTNPQLPKLVVQGGSISFKRKQES